jgi:hypothetical protein
MPGGILIKRQFEFEIDTWKRMLTFLSDENINAKNRLSDIVKDIGNNDGELMERAEYFHSCLLKEDEIIDFLYREVLERQRVTRHNSFELNEPLKETIQSQERLRKELEKAKNYFFELNVEFNKYFSEIL